MTTLTSNQPKCQEGYWTFGEVKALLCMIQGDEIKIKNLICLDYPDLPHTFVMTVHYGDFGEAHEDIKQATGRSKYNVCIKNEMWQLPCVLNEAGTNLHMWGWANKMEVWKFLSADDLIEMKDNRDDYLAPSCPHIKERPGKSGRVFWLSGPPGAGKSTTCQLLARNNEFIYYEADCMMQMINPFTDVYAENPTLASFESRPLKGIPKDEAYEIIKSGQEMDDFLKSKQIDGEAFDKAVQPLYTAMANDIIRQKKRLGGDFAIAHAVATRASRDYIRNCLGDDVVFVVLNLTAECQTKRIKGRHGDQMEGESGNVFGDMFKIYEPAQDDEPNAYNVTVDDGDTPDGVVKKVLDLMKDQGLHSVNTDAKEARCQEGYWNFGAMKAIVNMVEGNKMKVKNLMCMDYPDLKHTFEMDIEYGNFGEPRQEIKEASGKSVYNIHLKSSMMGVKGVLNDEGTKIWMWGFANELETWELITPEKIEAIKKDRDHYLTPSCPHIKERPGKPGKIYWLSGPPGAGKSTTCQLMARKNDFAYYEADAMMQLINPFTDIYVDNPTTATFKSKPLKGMPKEIAEAIIDSASKMEAALASRDSKTFDALHPLYKEMADDILRQKKRLGGDFAIAHAVATRTSRDFIRNHMGKDVIFIVLNLTEQCQKARLRGRHGDQLLEESTLMTDMFKFYEAAGEDEPNAYNVTIEDGESPDDVLQNVLDLIRNTISA